METVKKLAGTENYEEWLKDYVKKYKEKHLDKKEEVVIKKYVGKQILKNNKTKFNIGYLFLKQIYNGLKLNEICNNISDKYRYKFNLNDIFSSLIFGRIIYPSSKLKTYKLSKNFLQFPDLKLQNMYRGLSYLCNEMDYIQEKIFENSLNLINRNSRVIYFECTNYYFEINNEDDLRKYGINKQHQPKPQVGMGLFMDGDGIPLAMNIFPGNASETKQLIPTQNKIIKKFKLKDTRLVICTDAALCTDEIKSFNIKDGRGFVITQSLKKIKANYRKEALDPSGWRLPSDLKNIYNIKQIEKNKELYEKHYNNLFYKIIQTETASVKQDLIVTFSFKYKEYHNQIRENQIIKALTKINTNKNGEKLKKRINQNDYRRFIKEDIAEGIKNEKEKIKYEYSINQSLIEEEQRFDGFYALTTNLIDDISVILKIARRRWEIEESFKIMKQDFLARPVQLSREDRIKAHFLTCYIALIIYRILEKNLNYCKVIIHMLHI